MSLGRCLAEWQQQVDLSQFNINDGSTCRCAALSRGISSRSFVVKGAAHPSGTEASDCLSVERYIPNGRVRPRGGSVSDVVMFRNCPRCGGGMIFAVPAKHF